jgi:hypothetical protein
MSGKASMLVDPKVELTLDLVLKMDRKDWPFPSAAGE